MTKSIFKDIDWIFLCKYFNCLRLLHLPSFYVLWNITWSKARKTLKNYNVVIYRKLSKHFSDETYKESCILFKCQTWLTLHVERVMYLLYLQKRQVKSKFACTSLKAEVLSFAYPTSNFKSFKSFLKHDFSLHWSFVDVKDVSFRRVIFFS